MKMFLKVVLFVFEHPLLLTSDYAEKLEDAFHWGLTAQDREMREKFLIVFERNLAVNPIARLTTMHAVAGFRSSSLSSDMEADVQTISSTLYNTKIDNDSKADEDVPMETDQLREAGNGDSNIVHRMDVLLEDQKNDIAFIGDMFSHLFHSLWISMSEEERNYIGGLAVPFMTSGVHVQQAHAVHPVINNFLLETFSQCNPPIHIDANANFQVKRW
ncbi:hypothetical protein OSTOST_09908, partial [Ostertagia ostertagi]